MNCLNTWPLNVLCIIFILCVTCLVNKYYNTIQLLNIPPASISITTITYNHNYSYNYSFSSINESKTFCRMIWLKWEGNKLKTLIPQDLIYNVSDPRMPSFPRPRGVVSDDVIDRHVKDMVEYLARFLKHFKAMTTKRLTWNDLDVLGFWNCLNVFKLMYVRHTEQKQLSVFKHFKGMAINVLLKGLED